MKYRLFEDSDGAPRTSLAEVNVASNLASVDWAKGWLDQHGTHDRYTIERADGGFAACLIQTAGGQWYAMPKTGFFAD